MNPKSTVLPVAFAAILLSGCSTLRDTQLMQAETLSRVASLQSGIDTLTEIKQTDEAAKEIDAQLEERTKALRALVNENSAKYTNFDQFINITLPENPTDADVTKYVRAILSTSELQSSYNNKDLQVKLITQLGNARLPILLEIAPSYVSGDYKPRYHLKYAIEQLVTMNDKDLVIATLKNSPTKSRNDFFSLITKMNWEASVKDLLVDTIKQSLKSTSNYLDSNVLQMLVKLEDPETYPLLIEAVASSSNFSYNYKTISKIKGFDTDKLMAEAWKMRLSQSSRDQIFIAQYAAQMGDAIALDMIVSALTPNPRLRLDFDPRFAVLACIDNTGSNERIIRWYNENKDDLSFNKQSGKFHCTTYSICAPVAAPVAEPVAKPTAQPVAEPIAE